MHWTPAGFVPMDLDDDDDEYCSITMVNDRGDVE